jgi:hypothetical protein
MLSMDRLTSRRLGDGALAMVRDLLLIGVAGIAAAWIGQLLGRPARLGVGIPLVGSLAATLPRALVLLLVLARVRRPGALTGAAVCEVLSRAAMGMSGLGLMAFVAPVLGGVLADLAWKGTGKWRSVGARLAVAGAVLSGARVLAAWTLLVLLASPARGAVIPAAAGAVGIVGFDALLGAVAGLLVAPSNRRKEPQK